MELNREQQLFVTANESKILLLSGAGAGKTASLVSRTKRLIDDGADPSKIVVLTFTNMATEELRKRLEGYSVQIFTIHGYCNYLLLSGGYDTSSMLNDEKFDRLFSEIQKHPECAREVEHLLLDEGHDTDKNQFDFIFNIVKPKNWVVCADPKQTIYEWRGAYPDFIWELMDNPEVAIYRLNFNYRCKKRILAYAKNIIERLGTNYLDTSRAVNEGGHVYEVDYDLKFLVKLFKKYTDFKNWFVLARSNQEIELIGKLFDKYEIPYATFKQGDISLEQLKEEMDKNQILLLTIHSAKGLERSKVVVVGAVWWGGNENVRVNYVAATRAMDVLIWFKQKKKKKEIMMNWE